MGDGGIRFKVSLPAIYISFKSRESRSKFVYLKFRKYLFESVLDVGCFEAPLRDFLKSIMYIGVDISGKPDIKLNLEEIYKLPFKDESFYCVLCIDVLEHLDNLHMIFDELIRVSKRYIIISLPNCWCDARQAIERGKGHFGHYGLPLQKPKDRHKWFFSLSEAKQFLEGKSKILKFKFTEVFVTEKPRNYLIRILT